MIRTNHGRPVIAKLLFASALLLISSFTHGSTWPSQPVRIIVPFAPGASNDVMARALAQPLGEALGQTVIVENRPGAGGAIGANFVAKSKPDGYTLLLTSNALASASAVQQTPYDPAKDFDIVARVAKSPFLIVARQDLPVRTVPELIKYAKDNDTKLNYGTTGVGDNIHLATVMFSEKAGIHMTAIAYKGVSPALADLIAGRIDLLFTSVSSVKNSAAVELPIIAVTSQERNELVGKQVPTVREYGIDYAVDIWWAVLAPAGLSEDVRNRLNNEINKILSSPGYSELLNRFAAQAPAISYNDMQQRFVEEVSSWRAIAESSGLRK